MFIIWGSKRVEKKLGSVADFCPICRDIRPFQLIRVGIASHIYYVSIGEGKLAGHIIQCDACGVQLGAEPTQYVTTVKKPQTDLEGLVQDTFPSLQESHADRLMMEDRIKRADNTLSQDDRDLMIMEPFALLNPLVERRFENSTEMDKPAGLGCLGTILGGVGLLIASMSFQGPAQDKMLIATAILFGIGTLYTFIMLHLGPGRFFRSRVLPQLVKSLKPLVPTDEEIIASIDRCKKLGLKIGKVARPTELRERLERAMMRESGD